MDSESQVINPAAELDMVSAPHLGRQVIESLAKHPRRLVLDFSGVHLVDSAAIGVLLSAQRRVRAAGAELVIANASEHVLHVFELTGVQRTLVLEQG